VISLKYGLRKKFALKGKRGKVIRDKFPEYLHYTLLAPRKRLKINEGLRRQLADLIVTRCSPDSGTRKIPTTTARNYIPDQLTEWGRAQLAGGGDRIKGHALINENRPARRRKTSSWKPPLLSSCASFGSTSLHPRSCITKKPRQCFSRTS